MRRVRVRQYLLPIGRRKRKRTCSRHAQQAIEGPPVRRCTLTFSSRRPDDRSRASRMSPPWRARTGPSPSAKHSMSRRQNRVGTSRAGPLARRPSRTGAAICRACPCSAGSRCAFRQRTRASVAARCARSARTSNSRIAARRAAAPAPHTCKQNRTRLRNRGHAPKAAFCNQNRSSVGSGSDGQIPSLSYSTRISESDAKYSLQSSQGIRVRSIFTPSENNMRYENHPVGKSGGNSSIASGFCMSTMSPKRASHSSERVKLPTSVTKNVRS